MRWIRFAVLITMVGLLQAGAINMFALKGIRPNLLLIVMVFFAIYSSTYDAIITSFCIGFIADVVGQATMGVWMLSFGVSGTLLAYLHSVVQIRKISYQAGTIFMISMFAGFLAGLLNLILKEPVTGVWALLFISLYSAVLGPFLFLPSAWVVGVKMQRF
jgi:rod shape-determining protein MreD